MSQNLGCATKHSKHSLAIAMGLSHYFSRVAKIKSILRGYHNEVESPIPTVKTARRVRINIIRKILLFSLVGIVNRGVGAGEVDEMHVGGTYKGLCWCCSCAKMTLNNTVYTRSLVDILASL